MLPAPTIILVHPQMGENIGMVARAMANFGLSDLRLVRPRDLWPNPNAIQTAAGAHDILNHASLHEAIENATEDLQYVYASTVRPRHLEKKVFTTANFISSVPSYRWGILFGPENAGLSNEDISKANAIVTIPTNPIFGSLNLSHAVTICCYEWYLSETSSIVITSQSELAAKKEVNLFLEHLETSLEKKNFFLPTHKRDKMIWNLRSIFQRVHLTEQEVRTLRGVIKTLAKNSEN